ncbi:MAG: KilA-N domain-containing protein [Prevotella sp.]|nr:KilA-N domain-containing protein [Prevotella sp.]
MVKTSILKVQGIEIAITTQSEEDFICLTDMARYKDNEPSSVIGNWIRNRNTMEYLGTWEILHNPNFKPLEFEGFMKEAGLNRFTLSPQKWINSTNAVGLISRSGKHGGTYAHKDIAFNFGMWLSPVFQLYIVKEYQRLKEIESNQYNLEWNVKRVLSKANYTIHTDAIKQYVIPNKAKGQKDEYIYASEADMLNLIMFGCTAKTWREYNPGRVLNGENIRDMASINDLAILSNLESLNAILMKQGLDRESRYKVLKETAAQQRAHLEQYDYIKSLKKLDDTTYIEEENKTDFDKALTKALNYNPNEEKEPSE